MRLVSLILAGFMLSFLALVASPQLRPDVMVRTEAKSGFAGSWPLAGVSSWTARFLGTPAMAMPRGISWPGPFRVRAMTITDVAAPDNGADIITRGLRPQKTG